MCLDIMVKSRGPRVRLPECKFRIQNLLVVLTLSKLFNPSVPCL